MKRALLFSYFALLAGGVAQNAGQPEVYANVRPERTAEEVRAASEKMAPVIFKAPADRWQHLVATKKSLDGEDGAELRIVMLGDSIVNDTWRSRWGDLLNAAWPRCRISLTAVVRGGTGCWWYRDAGRVQQFVLPHRPQLLIIGGISHNHDAEAVRDVIRQVRAAGPCDVLLLTGGFGSVDPRDEKVFANPESDYSKYRVALAQVALQEKCAFLDQWLVWAEYIRRSGQDVKWFMRDPVHANAMGEQILGRPIAAFLSPSGEESASPRKAAEPGAQPATWRELPAVRLTDGRSEAVVVPSLGGRVVHFGLIGGLNWLWTGEPGAEKKMPALFWGGDKTYLGPHTLWALAQDSMWPPPAPDYQPCEVVEPRGLFSTLSAPWPGSGARIRRDYSFGENGELVIAHSVAPIPGSREISALWVIAQTIPTDAVFMPLAMQSPYTDGYFRFGFEKPARGLGATLLSPTLLQLKPEPGVAFKLGAHPTTPALATAKDGLVFLQRADPQKGIYPEGADGAGLSVEVYHHDLKGPGEYVELEQLSPLRRLDAGLTLTTRWSIHPLPATPPEARTRELLRLLELPLE